MAMPMIDIYAPSDLLPTGSDRQLAQELTAALLRAEGVANPGPAHTNNTGAYVSRICGDPTQVGRTWVLLTEAAEGGWGIGGTAFGRAEFAALLVKKGN
jgi:phenylpyruvate tautomerase PptA (4-oxalocrotonate tautomerase family)